MRARTFRNADDPFSCRQLIASLNVLERTFIIIKKGLTLTEILAALLPVVAENCDAIFRVKSSARLNFTYAAFRRRIAPTSVCGRIGQHGKTLDTAVCGLHAACFPY
jgi:hypothetical protein